MPFSNKPKCNTARLTKPEVNTFQMAYIANAVQDYLRTKVHLNRNHINADKLLWEKQRETAPLNIQIYAQTNNKGSSEHFQQNKNKKNRFSDLSFLRVKQKYTKEAILIQKDFSSCFFSCNTFLRKCIRTIFSVKSIQFVESSQWKQHI